MSEETGQLVCGLHMPQSAADAAHLLQIAREDGFDYVTTSLPHASEPRADVTALESRWWRTSIVGMVPKTIGNISSTGVVNPLVKQMEWATHMGIPAVIVPPIPTDVHEARDYARLCMSVALTSSGTNCQVWIKTYLTDESLQRFSILHKLCDGASNLGMLLSMDDDGAASPSSQSISNPTAHVAYQITMLHKAIGLQLKALSFPTRVFLTNKRGYPALSKSHQVLFTEALRRVGRTLRVLIEGPSAHPGTQGGATQCLPYLQYVRHMRQRPDVISILDSPEASLEEPFLDHLQRPLQPLGDHLEFSTYETFEKDPTKYTEYQKALFFAIRDYIGTYQAKFITILVAGAGRGPLVTASIKAMQELNLAPGSVSFSLFALEKNPSAVVYLQSMALHDPNWKNYQVQVIAGDMRTVNRASLPTLSADIVVSELLGSFGDNELSPECIDELYGTGLLRETTICIPSHYTSYVAPVSSVRLHAEVRAQAYFPSNSAEGLDCAPMGTLKAMETPYVVRPHAACQTHVEQPCWEFSHPSTSANNRERTAHVEFRPDILHGAGCGPGYGPFDQAVASIAQSTSSTKPTGLMVHGFLGTFTAILYAGKAETVAISTRPQNFSTGMFSWFPLYFPLKEALMVPAGASVQLSIWRKSGNHKVWYEWCATSVKDDATVGVTAIHNPNGRSYHVNL